MHFGIDKRKTNEQIGEQASGSCFMHGLIVPPLMLRIPDQCCAIESLIQTKTS
jgi:hypothetical protein